MSTARAADKTWDFTNDPSGELTIAGNNDQPWQNAGGNPGGFLALTYPQNSQYAAIVFPNLDPGRIVTGFTLSADLRIGNPSGDRAADGFSVSFARDGDPILADPGSDSGFAGRCCAETGTRTGIAVSFDTWSGNTFPNDPADTTDIEGVIVRLDDVTVKKVGLPTRNGACDDLTSLQTGPRDASFWAAGGDTRSAAAWKTLCWKTLAVNLTTDGRLTVSWKGNILLDGFQTTYFPTAGQLVLAARTGGANEHTHFDNLKLTTIAQTVTAVPGAPSNLKAAEAGANRVLLTWDKAVVAGDPNAKVAYDILRDGNVIASTVTSLSFEDRGVNPGRSYTYIVRGKNIAGTAGPNATVSVKTAGLVDTLGFLQAKVWYGIGGTAVDALLSDPHYQDPPDSTRYVNGFSFGETSGFGNTYGDNFGVMIQGSFTAPETGSYRFFVRSDDASQLFINTAGGTAPDPRASTPIANEDGCCKGFLEDAPYASEPIALTAGRQYGLTFVVKEGGGGDWGQVAIRKEGDSTPAGNLTPIRGAILAGKGDAVGASVSFVRQPANLTVTANGPVEMSAEATGSSPYGADYGKAVVYQWYVNNAPVLGANGPVFSVNVTPKAYNGAKVKVVASVAGASVTSAEAILTVNDDKVAPAVKRISGSDTFDSITVLFNEPVVDPSALDASKYKVTGLTLSNGKRLNDRTVKFTTSKQAVGTKYDVTINGVLDLGSNPSAYTGSFVSYKFQPGVVQFNLWLNQGGGFDTFPRDRAPDQVRIKSEYFTGTGLYEIYFGQLKGLFKAPKTGDYVFWMASDDHGELYLSTDENPANKRRIAEEPQWCDPMYWKTDGGANSGTRGEEGAISNRSDQYGGTEWATGAGGKITLTAGKSYYLEVLYKEGGGGDHGAATFSYLGDAVPANGQTALKGDVVGWYIDPQTSPPILTQGLTTQKYARGETLRFQLGVDSALPVTVTWYKNYKRIDGATGTTLEIPNAGPQHIGDYHAVVSNENGSIATNDGNNNGSRAIMTGAYVIESEDYNHSRGKTVDTASNQPLGDSLFRGLDGIPGFDINFANSTDDPCANGNSYRNGWNDNGTCVAFPVGAGGNVDVILDNGANQERPDYIAANNYKIGWMPEGAWFNYTRTFPAGNYNAVFVGSRDGRDVDANTVALEIVTDPTVENAPGTEVARVTFSNTGAWSGLDQIPFVNADGSPISFTLSGKTTIRVRNIRGATDHDYLLFYRTSDLPASLSQGLRAHYPFNGDVNDASGNARHGTPFALTATADRFGRAGKAYAFSSSASSYVALPEIHANLGAPKASFTISAWIKANARTGNNHIIAATDANPYQMPRLEVRGDRSLGYYHRVPAANHEGGGSTKISTDWNHVVYKVDGQTGTGRAFINGIEDTSFRFTFNPDVDRRNPQRVWAIGTTLNTTCGGCNPFFDGSIDEVRIYDRALSDPEVSDLYTYESLPPLPTIVTGPTDKALLLGQTLKLDAQITGYGISYRWQKNGIDLIDGGRVSGATTQTLTVTGFVEGDAGQYRLIARNAAGVVASSQAVVAVILPPVVTQQPNGGAAAQGQPLVLNAQIAGFGLVYRWQRNGIDLSDGGRVSGSTTPTLTIVDARADDAGQYRLVGSNAAGTATTSTASIVVLARPTIAQQPVPVTVSPGGSATFSVVASGGAPLAFQWFKEGSAVPGATGPQLVLQNVQLAQLGSYRVVVSNPAGTVTSDPAALAFGAGSGQRLWDFSQDPSGELTIAGNNAQPWQSAGGNPGGFLALTYPVNSQYTAIVFPNLDPGRIVTGFTLTADLRIGNPTGDRAADGFSVSFARDGDPILADPGSDGGFAGRCCAETGTRTGIAVVFDTWAGNTFPGDPRDTTDLEGIMVRVDDVTIKKVGLPTRNGACDDLTSLQTGPRDAAFWANGGDPYAPDAWRTLCWKPLAINLATDGRLSVSWKGNLLLDAFQTAYFPTAGQLVLAGRTGGANEHTHFDNLKLMTVAQTVTAVPGVVGNLKAAEAGANRVRLTWDAAIVAGDPNARVAYDILRDGAVIATTLTTLTFEDRGVTAGKSYTYIVRGKNIAGTTGPNATVAVTTAGLVDTLAFLQSKIWFGIGGTAVDALLSDPHFQDPPDLTRYVNGFSFGETSGFGNTYGDNFGTVIQGTFKAPETASYRFFIRSDDASQLFINTAGGTAPDPTASTPIANEDGCCKGFLEDAPYASEPIALTAGKQYGLTFVVKEGGGGDWGQVAIRKEGDPTPAVGLAPMRGAVLAGKGDAVGASVSFTRQPTNLTVTANGPAEISAEAAGSSPYGGDYGSAIVYQWYINNTAILGANGPVLSVNVTPKSYNGAKVKVVASVAGASVTSSEAILTVNDDKVAPTVKRVGGSESFDSMTVIFSEPVVDPSALNAANYKVTGLNVSSPVRVNDRTIRLTTSRQQVDTRYDLSIKGVLDLAGNPSAYIGSFVSYRFQSGVVRFNTWNNEGGGFDTFPRDRAPDHTFLKDQYFTGTGLFENYFGQLKGLFKAPKTGDYVFWISTDDHGELYLSSDENPANKRRIAEEPVWCDPMYWKTDGGANSGSRGGDGQLANRSDQYPGTEWPGGAGAKITLTAGQNYYLEVLYKEGGGGDHGAATFTYLGEAVPANGSTALKGDLVGWYIDPQTAPPIVTQAPTTQFYARGGSFRFDIGVQSALPVTVRWYQNKKLIEGVSGTTLEVQNADARHVGDYYAVISNENGSVSTWPDNNARAIMTGAYVIEAEDYNHGRGKSILTASTMPVADSLYRGLDGIPGTDFQFNSSTEDPCANGNSYRNGWNNNGNCVAFPPGPGGNVDVILDNGVNQERPDYTAANNYKIGWTGATTWFNYTRTLQPGVYNAVFVGSHDGLDPNFNTVALEIVTDPTLENAPGIEVARVTFANTGGWSSNDQIPFVSPDGSPSPIPIDGTTTLRLRCTQGNPDFDYVLLYRASGVAVAQNPADQQSVAGTTLTLTAKVAGLGLTYRWQKDGVDLVDDGRVSGAATDTLRIGGVAPSDAGRYRLWSGNAEGTVETTEAVVTVLVPPAIVEQPQSVEGLLEETVTLRVGVVGSPTPTLQWFKNDSLIPGATSETLVLEAFQKTDAGTYTVRVSNSSGTVTSAPAVVTFVDGVRVLVDGVVSRGVYRTLDPVTIDMQFALGDWLLFYTLDGTEPNFVSNPYAGPFVIAGPVDIRVAAYSPDFSNSRVFDGISVRFLQPQVLEWGALPNLRYKEAGLVGVSSTSGLPVTLKVASGPAKLIGNQLTATGVGTVVLVASQAGTDTFAAVSEERTLQIGRAVQGLVWPILEDRTFGQAPFGVTVTSGSGLPVVLTVESGKATLSGGTITLTGAGTVTLKATQSGNSNYEPVSETRGFTVAKAEQTLTFASIANRAYSPDVFTPVAVASSKLPVAFEVLSGPAEVSGTGLRATGVGSVVVRAQQQGNEDYLPSLPSDRTFSITQGTQTLTFTSVGAKTFGEAPVTLKATSNRDLPITYRVLSGPGRIEGDRLIFTGAGTVAVQAIQAGTDLYAAAAASQNIVVAKSTQTLTFAAIPDQGYVASPLPLSASSTSGLPVSFRLVSGAATVSGAELRLTGVGTIAVAADQAGNSNYLAATSVTNRFTVARGTQEITFNPIGDQVLGGAVINLTASSSVGLPVVFQVVSGPASVSGSQLTLTGAGSVTVRARQVGSPLWSPAQVDQVFTAVKGTPKISFTAVASKRFGDAPVTLQASSSAGGAVGFRIVSGPGSIAGNVLTLKGAGQIVVEVFQAATALFEASSLQQSIDVAKGTQVLTFGALADVAYSKNPIPLTASTTSGLPIRLRVVQGPATIEGSGIRLSGVGQVTVEAAQDGDDNWMSADPVQRTFQVTKAAQSLTFAALADRSHTTNGINLVATSTSGLPVEFQVVNGPATLTGSRLQLTGVGKVTVRAVQSGDALFEAAVPQDRSFVVTKAAQTLTFTTVGSRVFGSSPVTLAASSSSGLGVAFRVLSGPGSISASQLTLSGAGDIVVEAFQNGTDLVEAATARQTITVTRASQTISFAALANRGYSTNGIPLQAESTSGLPVSFRLVSGPATVSGSEVRLTGVGTVAVAADQAGNANYAAAGSVTNSFVVGRGSQEITFSPIGDQFLSSASVTLKATSSSGLSVAFVVLSGPATLSGNQLTLLNSGAVTVRAFNPGSPLWLSGQVEQTFQILKQATLSVTVEGQVGGTVSVSPLKERYEPSDSVTLTAKPAEGFVFESWGGDLSGSANPTTLAMNANRVVTARFKDGIAPVLVWDQPVGGTTGNERVALTGRITDNAGAPQATWSRDGGAPVALAIGSGGGFRVDDLVLNPGTNRFRIVIRDTAGNETSEERAVVWVPERVLRVVDALEVQEGQRSMFAVQLSSQTDDVAGLTFRLGYDPAYLTDPRVEWGAVVGQSVNNVNTSVPGEIAGSFALAGTGLPAGTNLIATVSFRARSVPWSTNVSVNPEIVSIGTPTGSVLNFGNATLPGRVSIVPRKIRGDNNANQRLDIGDATVISRLQVGLEPVRPWDLALNDLNGNKSIDTGDVIKVLRVVVGLDPQPKSAPRVGPQDLSSQLLRSAGLNTNDVATLEFPDGLVAQPGRPYRVVVKLSRSEAVISGMSFTVNHPLALTLIDKQLGNLVPSDALPLWADAPGSVQLAALRSTPWPSSTGVAAVLTFLPTAEITSRASWPIEVARAELAGAGFDVRTPVDVRAEVLGIPLPTGNPKMVLSQSTTGEDLLLDVEADAQTTLVLETTTDLMNWTEDRRLNGQGLGSKIRLRMTRDENSHTQFWRIRVP